MWKVAQIGILFSGFSLLIFADIANGQVKSDLSTGTEITNPKPNVSVVKQGTQVGKTLFHSFQEFSIPAGHRVRFQPKKPGQVQTVFARVTGNKTSDLQGSLTTVQALQADVVLLNPNGIVFGEDFELDINGSFLATTAESVLFEGGDRFSTDLANTSPLLKLSVPIGLQFGPKPGPIHIFTGNEKRGFSISNSLRVPNFQKLALIGGDIIFDTGKVVAPGGNIWLGSLKEPGIVSWTYGGDWDFIPQPSQGRGFISLRESSRIVSSFNPQDGAKADRVNGLISVFGDTVKIENSEINAENLGKELGGNIVINATQTIEILTTALSETDTTVTTQTLARGDSGDIQLSAKYLKLLGSTTRTDTNKDLTQVIASSAKDRARVKVDALGGPGNIQLLGTEQVELQGDSVILTVTSNLASPSGNIDVKTKRLRLLKGPQIRSSTEGRLSGGIIDIEAEESVLISGFLDLTRGEARIFRPSGLSSDANRENQGGLIRVKTPYLRIENGAAILSNVPEVGSQAPADRGIGRSGDIEVQTERLELANGGQILANANNPEAGTAGTIDIQASEYIVIEGTRLFPDAQDSLENRVSAIQAETSTQEENAVKTGDIVLATPLLILRNQALISASSNSTQGGNIRLDISERLILDRSSRVVSNTQTGKGGDIDIETTQFELTNGGQIIANSESLDKGTAGNIDIQAKDYIAIRGSAELGNDASPSGIQAITNTKQAITNTLDNGTGNITLKTPILTLQEGALISADSNSTQGGDITLNVGDRLVLDQKSKIVSNTQTGVGGDIDIATRKLEITERSQIIANSEDIEAGAAGNIDIQAKDYIVVRGTAGQQNDASSSGIQAETKAQQTTVNKTGNIELKTPSLILQNRALISANSEGTQGGNIILDINDLLFLNQSSRIISNAKNWQWGECCG